jgi:uncharacterized alpha-E superfamily protein
MAMLSRVADAVFWIGRYVERAENTARLIDVALRSSRELSPVMRLDPESEDDRGVVLIATASQDAYAQRYGAITEDGLATFLVTDTDNPNSVLSCLLAARNNARGVRDAITSEMWEELNRLYLRFSRVTSAYLLLDGLHDFCREIRLASQLFQGVTEATMPRDEAWSFLQVGTFLERASMTARILDTRTAALDAGAGRPSPEETHRWLSLLRSVSAYEAYSRLVHGGVQPAAVADFLLFSRAFPRTVVFGIEQVRREIEAIDRDLGPQRPEPSPAAVAGALGQRLRALSVEDLGPGGLHLLLDSVESDCNAIGDAIRRAYFENVVAGAA